MWWRGKDGVAFTGHGFSRSMFRVVGGVVWAEEGVGKAEIIDLIVRLMWY